MPLPTAVFLDTSVFDGQQYNFSSTALSTFTTACQHRKLKLLLPDPTEREIRRHMRERSKEALAGLEKARRTAPFLTTWKNIPKPETAEVDVSKAHDEWHRFLKQFDVIRLGYEQINLPTIMNWYDAVEPPFGEGKKRKEFPDAFAIAILVAFAGQYGSIAVVSSDNDIKESCNRLPQLMLFPSLPALTELLLAEEDNRIAAFRATIDANLDQIAQAVRGAISEQMFYVRLEYASVSKSEVSAVRITDTRIVSLGEQECVIVIVGMVEVRHHFKWAIPGPTWTQSDIHLEGETVSDSYNIQCTAKLLLDTTTGTLVAIPFVKVDNPAYPIKKIPQAYWDLAYTVHRPR